MLGSKPTMIISTSGQQDLLRWRLPAETAGTLVCTWMILPMEAICWPPITPTVTKSPITMVMTKMEPMMMPVRRQRHDHVPQRLPATGTGCRSAASSRRAVDAHHRVEDGHDHEHGVEMHKGQRRPRSWRTAATPAVAPPGPSRPASGSPARCDPAAAPRRSCGSHWKSRTEWCTARTASVCIRRRSGYGRLKSTTTAKPSTSVISHRS